MLSWKQHGSTQFLSSKSLIYPHTDKTSDINHPKDSIDIVIGEAQSKQFLRLSNMAFHDSDFYSSDQEGGYRTSGSSGRSDIFGNMIGYVISLSFLTSTLEASYKPYSEYSVLIIKPCLDQTAFSKTPPTAT